MCKDCNSAFTFTVREQTAFAAKGFPAKVRCADCTRAKKVRRGARARTHARHTRTANARDGLHAHCSACAERARCPCQERRGESTGGGGGGGGGKKTLSQTRCFNCGKKGHTSQDCPKPQGSTACFVCGSEDHQSRSCPKARTDPNPNRPKPNPRSDRYA